MLKYEQPELPLAQGRPIEEVWWINANVRQAEKRRWFGKKIVSELIIDENGRPETTTIRVDEIGDLKDPSLRYALRFAAAAHAVGWVDSGYGGKGRHSVIVKATDEGLDSRLISAVYSGIGRGDNDTFMVNLRFEPDHDENYQDSAAS